jgi:hypothetical protein
MVASATNNAGSVDVAETPGPLVDCLPLGDLNIVYKRDAIYAMQFIPGNDVFSVRRLPGDDGLFGRGCVVNTPVGHVFLSQTKDVRLLANGTTRSIADGRVKNWLASTINITYAQRSFLCVHPNKTEIWVCFADTAATGSCRYAAVWNWKDDTWGIFDFNQNNINFAASGTWPSSYAPSASVPLVGGDLLIGCNNSDRIGIVSDYDSNRYLGTGITKSLTRDGIHLDDRVTFKTLQRSRWDVTNAAGLTVTHGSAKFSDAAPTMGGGVSFVGGSSQWANSRATSGPFLSVSITFGSDIPAVLRSGALDVTGGGKR